MKKFLFIALAAFAMFSCNKIEEEVVVENEPQSLRYIFSVADKPSFDVDTKAVKTSWEEGDLIYIVFDDQLPTSLSDFTILEYKSNDWTVKQESGKAPLGQSGTLDALYYGKPIIENSFAGEEEFIFETEVSEHSKYMFLNAKNISYTIKDNELTASLSLDFEPNDNRTYVQFCITGLEGEWEFVSEDLLNSSNNFAFWAPSYQGYNNCFSYICYANEPSYPFDVREDGYYLYSSVQQNAESITISLIKKDGDNAGKYQKTFSKKITGKCAAITFKGPKFNDSGECTNGWERLEEQSCNIIYYTSIDGSIVYPNSEDCFGSRIVSNDYKDGQGVIVVERDITSIGSYAFQGRTELTSIIMPESVKLIGVYAFMDCTGLIGELVLPSSLTSIGIGAFWGCNGLTGNLVLPSGITFIGYGAFHNCSGFNGTLTLPSDLITIGVDAFSGCSGFSGELILPSSLTTIGSTAFLRCRGFSGDLIFPPSLTSLGESAFAECTGFSGDLTFTSSLESINDFTFMNCSGFNGTLTLPSDLITIGFAAFDGCSGLTGSLDLPSSLTKIEDRAFYGCSGFTGDLSFPSSMTSIGQWAFQNCGGFNSVLSFASGIMTIGGAAFAGCSGFTGDLILPSSITTIGDSAFNGCSGFNGKLTLPSGISIIEGYSFAECSGLTGPLTLPSGLTSIGNEAFRNCSGLTGALIIPASVTEIKEQAFYYCSGFNGSLSLPSNLTTIGDLAFFRCSGFDGELLLNSELTNVGRFAFYYCGFTGDLTLPLRLASISENAFSGNNLSSIHIQAIDPPIGGRNMFDYECPIYVPAQSLEVYKAADYWSDYSTWIQAIND